MLNYKQSLIGFHNPCLHKDLTPDEFLEKYVSEVLEKRGRKKDGLARIKLAEWIREHWEDQLKFVRRLLYNTLKMGGKRVKKVKEG